jgi:hypothetical protein
MDFDSPERQISPARRDTQLTQAVQEVPTWEQIRRRLTGPSKVVPFKKSVELLSQITKKLAPFEKLKLISQISMQITNDVDEFWKGVNVPRSKLVLDGENLILIYEYILTRTNILDLAAHIQLCYDFSTPFLKTTKYGYCWTTIDMAMTLLTETSESFSEPGSEEQKGGEMLILSRDARSVISANINTALKTSKEARFSLDVQENILSNIVDSVKNRSKSMHRSQQFGFRSGALKVRQNRNSVSDLLDIARSKDSLNETVDVYAPRKNQVGSLPSTKSKRDFHSSLPPEETAISLLLE